MTDRPIDRSTNQPTNGRTSPPIEALDAANRPTDARSDRVIGSYTRKLLIINSIIIQVSSHIWKIFKRYANEDDKLDQYAEDLIRQVQKKNPHKMKLQLFAAS